MADSLKNPDELPSWEDINRDWPEPGQGAAGVTSGEASIDSRVDTGSVHTSSAHVHTSSAHDASAASASAAPTYTPAAAPAAQAVPASRRKGNTGEGGTAPAAVLAQPLFDAEDPHQAESVPGADAPAGDVRDISDAVNTSPPNTPPALPATPNTAVVSPHHYNRVEQWLFTTKRGIETRIEEEKKKYRHYVPSRLDTAVQAGINWYLSRATAKIPERSYQSAIADTGRVITLIDSEVHRLENRIDYLTEQNRLSYEQDAELESVEKKTLEAVHDYRSQLAKLEQDHKTVTGCIKTELKRELSKMRGDRIRTQLQYESIHAKRSRIRERTQKRDYEIERISAFVSKLSDDRGCLEAAKEDLVAQHERLYQGDENDDASSACYRPDFQQAVTSHFTYLNRLTASYRSDANQQEEADIGFNLREAQPPHATPAVLKEQQLNRQYVEDFDRRLDQLEQESKEWEMS